MSEHPHGKSKQKFVFPLVFTNVTNNIIEYIILVMENQNIILSIKNSD